MGVVSWQAGRVSTEETVEVRGPVTGKQLRDAYAESVAALFFRLVRFTRNAVRIGPIELLRFGEPEIGPRSVDWPIEGGLLAGASGGHWRIESRDGQVQASVTSYRPSIPRPLYALTQLQVHLLFTRLYLLRVHGANPLPGRPAPREDRWQAAAVDVAFCLTLAGLTGRRRPRRTLLITAAYHIACWSLAGRTLGGLVLRQRVVSADGSRLTPAQATLRLALAPVGWLARRPIHDEIACTMVITDPDSPD
jgi:hypothetical protein